MACIEARGLRKAFGSTVALDGVDLRVEEGRILGLIGPNGAGKTTALNAILGLAPYQGDLRVLGRDPWTERDRLMRDVSFIADVAVLPRWLRVSQALEYVAGVHPRFDRAKAEGFLAKTTIRSASKVRELSKGMVAQLHLALVMAIDASLLVLDEPTLGLDILYRKQFYDSLLNDYFDRRRTILVTTHQVEEIQDVLTDVAFIDRGRIVLHCSMDEFGSRYLEVMAHPGTVAAARALGPIHERQVFGRSILLFDRADRDQLTPLGDVRTPGIADVFVAVMGHQQARHQERPDESSLECSARVSLRLAGVAPAPAAATRPFYWSVRRELWESRSITVAPLAVAAVVLFSCFISAMTLPHRMQAVLSLDAAKQRATIEKPFAFAAGLMVVTAFLVGAFYCLDALHGERRDRSILFWKSLPVSDLTTVLAKASIPLAVLPALVFAIIFAIQTTTLLLSTAMLVGHGPGVATLWARLPIVQMWLATLYALAAIALWHAPIYGLLLLVSGFARRAAFLWAALPLLAICAFERIAFGTSYFALFLGHRLIGWFTQGFVPHTPGGAPMDPLAAMTPGRFLGTPGLWIGLLLAAGLLAAAVRLRRQREPI